MTEVKAEVVGDRTRATIIRDNTEFTIEFPNDGSVDNRTVIHALLEQAAGVTGFDIVRAIMVAQGLIDA